MSRTPDLPPLGAPSPLDHLDGVAWGGPLDGLALRAAHDALWIVRTLAGDLHCVSGDDALVDGGWAEWRLPDPMAADFDPFGLEADDGLDPQRLACWPSVLGSYERADDCRTRAGAPVLRWSDSGTQWRGTVEPPPIPATPPADVLALLGPRETV